MRDRSAYELLPLRCVPGSPSGAGGAFTGGEKLLGPPGVRLFSVGVGATDDVVVVVVLDGLGDSLPPQPAVNVAIAMTALPPANNASRRPKRPDSMILSNPIPVLSEFPLPDVGRMNADVNIMPQGEQTAA